MRPLLSLVPLTVAAAPLGAQLSQELHPSWSPAGTQLVFESDRYGDPDLFVIDIASGDLRRLTDSPAEDARPVWSPDGSLIAFHSDRAGDHDIYVIRPDGTGLERMTSTELDETSPGWSPNSRMLVYELRRGDHWYLGVVDLRDRTTRVLIDRPGDHLTPTWPADDEVAFTYSPPGGNHDTDIILVTADTRGQVTGELLGGLRGNSNADFSRIGGRFVFNSIRDGDWEIYTADRDGTNSRRLTAQGGEGMVGIDGQPAWSPDGRQIAITSGRAGSLDIVIITADGDEIRNLTATWTVESR